MYFFSLLHIIFQSLRLNNFGHYEVFIPTCFDVYGKFLELKFDIFAELLPILLFLPQSAFLAIVPHFSLFEAK